MEDVKMESDEQINTGIIIEFNDLEELYIDLCSSDSNIYLEL